MNPREGSYGVEVGRRLKLLEINVWGVEQDKGVGTSGASGIPVDVREDRLKDGVNQDEGRVYAQSVFEVVIEEGMLHSPLVIYCFPVNASLDFARYV